jgi:hypothetical protein
MVSSRGVNNIDHEVLATVSNPLMDARYRRALLRALFTACGGLGEFARGPGQRGLFGTEKAGIRDLFSTGRNPQTPAPLV